MKRYIPVIVLLSVCLIFLFGLMFWMVSATRQDQAGPASDAAAEAVDPPVTAAETPVDPGPVTADHVDTLPEAEEPEPTAVRPRPNDLGRIADGDIVSAKNPNPVQLTRDSWLDFNDDCYLEETTVVVIGFLGEDILVRALGASPDYQDDYEDCDGTVPGCPEGTLFLIESGSWPGMVEEQAAFEAEQEEIEAEKEQIRRLLRR